MTARSALRPVLIAAAAAAVAIPASAQAAQTDRLAAGVRIGAVDVGGLTRAEARERIKAQIAAPLAQPIAVRARGRRVVLTPRNAGISVNAAALVNRAYAAGQRALRRVPRAQRAAAVVKVRVALGLKPDKAAVRAFVARADRKTLKRPRNAKLRYGVRRIWTTPSRYGRRLADRGRLGSVILATLVNPAADRALAWRTKPVKAPVTRRTLARRIPVIVTVSRSEHKVRVWKRFRVVRRFKVAVGQSGYPTPTGLFSVRSKSVNPSWSVPNSSWAGDLAGTTIPGGSSSNPLKARWIGITGSVGFHGTADLWSLGGNASHGCVRMRVPDVKDLYRRVRIGTPVYVR